jgi:hypothetical protein
MARRIARMLDSPSDVGMGLLGRLRTTTMTIATIVAPIGINH